MSPLLVVSILVAATGGSDVKKKDPVATGTEGVVYQYLPPVTLQPPKYGFVAVNQEQPEENIGYTLNNQIVPSLQSVQQNQQRHDLQTALAADPLLAALVLGSSLGIHGSAPSFNHPQHLPINPYVALLLSHYGRYISLPHRTARHGLYGYAAANNYHNNKPFGAYKIYEDP